MKTKTIKKEQFVKMTSERAFKALAENQELERWFVQEAEIELKLTAQTPTTHCLRIMGKEEYDANRSRPET